jgi:D-alanyl-D-alanine carboxypeptidase
MRSFKNLTIFILGLLVLSLNIFSCSPSRQKGPSPDTGPEPELLPDLGEAIARLSANGEAQNAGDSPARDMGDGRPEFGDLLSMILSKAEIPPEFSEGIMNAAVESPAFILDLLSCLEGDPFLRRLVDKEHPLPEGYEPDDLVELKNASYQVGRAGLMLRRAAADSLEEMAAAAKQEGVTLVASSAYRSFDYQVQVYNRVVREMGQAAADRESSRPGFSQHQTGLAVDFGSIDDSFAATKAGQWIAANSSRFGWSISFPDGYEALTGYRWESWHYRYVGRELAAFIDNYFGGIQQYALRFVFEWEGGGT